MVDGLFDKLDTNKDDGIGPEEFTDYIASE